MIPRLLIKYRILQNNFLSNIDNFLEWFQSYKAMNIVSQSPRIAQAMRYHIFRMCCIEPKQSSSDRLFRKHQQYLKQHLWMFWMWPDFMGWISVFWFRPGFFSCHISWYTEIPTMTIISEPSCSGTQNLSFARQNTLRLWHCLWFSKYFHVHALIWIVMWLCTAMLANISQYEP